MTRILVHENCYVFDAKCECGENVKVIYSDDIDEKDLIVDKKGWIYVMDEMKFIPKLINQDIAARSRCIECGLRARFWLQFRSGFLKFWSEITKHQEPFLAQDSETKPPEEDR
jgi:hypothetical protein